MFYNTHGTLVVWASTQMHSVRQHNLRVQNASRLQPYRTHRKFIDSMCSLNLFYHRMNENECDRDGHPKLKRNLLELATACCLLLLSLALVRLWHDSWTARSDRKRFCILPCDFHCISNTKHIIGIGNDRKNERIIIKCQREKNNNVHYIRISRN